ncbi:MAG: NAD(P)H-dependent oxidoreductase [Fibrobacterales bacterium]
MKILIVTAPEKPNSFNHAIADTAIAALKDLGHDVTLRNLVDEQFNPILTTEEILSDDVVPADVMEQITELVNADGVIVIHPNWWGMPPAIMKGWIDRVFRTNFTHKFAGGLEGLMKAQAAVVFTTANTPQEVEESAYGDPLQGLWEKCVFGLCGVTTFKRVPFASVIMSTPEERKEWLDQVTQTISHYFPK